MIKKINRKILTKLILTVNSLKNKKKIHKQLEIYCGHFKIIVLYYMYMAKKYNFLEIPKFFNIIRKRNF